MLVATPGQTATYSTLHNSSNGGGSNNVNAASATVKKSSTNSTTSGTSKPLNNNNNHTASTVTTKSSLNSNSNSTIHNNYHPNTKNDNIVLSKLSNQNKSIAASSREIISSSKKAATTHSLKTENSTNTTSTTNTKQPSFIQTLKDSVQKALISTTGNTSSSNTNSIAAKHSTDNKLQKNYNNSKTSVNNVTSSSSSTSHNANKISTTTSINTISNATAATQSSSSSAPVVRGKHFSCSVSKLHTVAPTIIHRYPEERQHASSTDSLHKEMCHFKPIRIVPKTPFKSGSKSRGNSLRFPKANLATKKTECVLKSNCDVNNRKRKQQQNQTQNDKVIVAADENYENEQENKDFRIYKPKPSLTWLPFSANTPNHTSAFVCLIEDMKTLFNMQSKNTFTSAVVDEPDDSIKELFSRKKQKPIKKQLQEEGTINETPKIRGYRHLTTKTVAKNKKNAKTNISKGKRVAITKAKSLRNVSRTKSKTNNKTLATAKTKTKLETSVSTPVFSSDKTKAVASTSKSTRKRKVAPEDDLDCGEQFMTPTLPSSPLLKNSISNKSILLTTRKSSRLSAKEMSAPAKKRARYSAREISSQRTTIKNSQKDQKNPKTVVNFSPPMTRSRLKHLTEQGKIVQTDVAVIRKLKM